MLAGVLRICDLASMAGSLGLAALVTFWGIRGLPVSELLAFRLGPMELGLVLVLLLLWHLGFAAFDVYHPGQALLGQRRLADVVKATALNAVFVLALSPLLGLGVAATLLAPLFCILASAGAVSSRLLLRLAVRHLGNGPRKVLIVGTSPRALRFAARIEQDPDSHTKVIGFVDDAWPGITDFQEAGGHVVCDQKNFASFVRDTVVDEVLITLPPSVLRKPGSTVLAACQEHGIRVRFLTSILKDLTLNALEGRGVDDAFLVTFANGTVEGWPMVAKRVLDVSMSLLLLVVTAPLFLVTALLVGVTSRGPVFFSQERRGLNKRGFPMYKFRTMVPGAEEKLPQLRPLNEAGGPVFKLKNDPRITPIGRILRVLSIDELPQLVNVLKGEMSLVGPRPLPDTDVEGFEEDRHWRRFSVTPGLTGLWQVNGRSSIPFEEWMELDLKYIDEWSLRLDLEILAKTGSAVLRGHGAE